MTSDIQGRLLAVALNSLRSRGKLLSGLRMFLRNAHLGVIIIGREGGGYCSAQSGNGERCSTTCGGFSGVSYSPGVCLLLRGAGCRPRVSGVWNL